MHTQRHRFRQNKNTGILQITTKCCSTKWLNGMFALCCENDGKHLTRNNNIP